MTLDAWFRDSPGASGGGRPPSWRRGSTESGATHGGCARGHAASWRSDQPRPGDAELDNAFAGGRRGAPLQDAELGSAATPVLIPSRGVDGQRTVRIRVSLLAHHVCATPGPQITKSPSLSRQCSTSSGNFITNSPRISTLRLVLADPRSQLSRCSPALCTPHLSSTSVLCND